MPDRDAGILERVGGFGFGAAFAGGLGLLHGGVGAVQLLGGDFPAVTHEDGQVVDAAVDGLVDELLVALAGFAQDEVDDGFVEVEAAGMADAQAQAPVATRMSAGSRR